MFQQLQRILLNQCSKSGLRKSELAEKRRVGVQLDLGICGCGGEYVKSISVIVLGSEVNAVLVPN